MSKNMTNREVAELLRMAAAAFEVKDEDFFRVRAYQNAAVSIEHASEDVRDLWEQGKLDDLSGIGPSLKQHLDELFRTGKVKHFEKEMRGLPEGMFEILGLSGVGPKTAIKLAREFGLDKGGGRAVEKLRKMALEEKIRLLDGFGEEREKQILEAIDQKLASKNVRQRLLIFEAEKIADDVMRYLEKCDEVLAVEVLGSLRRRNSTVGDVDLAVKTRSPGKVMIFLRKYPGIRKILSTGDKTTMFIHKLGVQVDVKTQTSDQWGSMLQHYTGSKHHNIKLRTYAKEKGLSLSEYGIKKGKNLMKFEDEESLYKALGMDYIPPELREDVGEIEEGISHRLPDLIEVGDIRGDLQMHSVISPETSHDAGESTIKELMFKGVELGYEYIGVTDHNPRQTLSKKRMIEVVKRRNELIEQEVYSYEKSVKNSSIKVIKSMEVDIRPNGELAVDDEVLELLDYAIVSIHSVFNQNRKKATERVIRGLSHDKVKILAHPTGRLINEREGIDFEWEKLFDFCVKNGKFLEINASPKRLDLADILAKEAVIRGVKLAISTDAHNTEGLLMMRYGVDNARRGWVEKKDVINTLPYEKLRELLDF